MRVAPALLFCAATMAAPALAAEPTQTRVPCKPPLAFAKGGQRAGREAGEPRAMLLLAVDRRLNGCRVLTPASARNDWLPEPAADGPARKRPARGG